MHPAILGLALCLLPTICVAGPAWRHRVDPWILTQLARADETEFLVLLEVQTDLTPAAAITDRQRRGRWVVDRLRQIAAATQRPLRVLLERSDARYRPFWVANMIWVRGDAALVETLARHPDVRRLVANPAVALALPAPAATSSAAPQGIEPNLVQIGAPLFWAAGYTGTGVVVAGQDTGYDWQHPALQAKYRGWNGATADHDYNWHDAIHAGGGSCGADSPEPCDDFGHGTHTLGTMVGDDGGANQIGVAPGARWIGCRNMNVGFGTPASYAECFEFFLAPTRVDGSDPDPAQAPHVINNSWVCPPSEGCTDPDALRTVVENVRAAGIAVVASAGNGGPLCGSVMNPPAIYGAAFSVGAVHSNDAIASFSSRGPVTVDGSNRLKPDVTAPGTGIRSAVPNGGYASMSGTSMAGPHVAGQVALLLSARPELTGDVETIERCIEATAVPLTTDESCGGILGTQIPNNTFGWGRIELALPLPEACAALLIYTDGFESGTADGWSEIVN